MNIFINYLQEDIKLKGMLEYYLDLIQENSFLLNIWALHILFKCMQHSIAPGNSILIISETVFNASKHVFYFA